MAALLLTAPASGQAQQPDDPETVESPQSGSSGDSSDGSLEARAAEEAPATDAEADRAEQSDSADPEKNAEAAGEPTEPERPRGKAAGRVLLPGGAAWDKSQKTPSSSEAASSQAPSNPARDAGAPRTASIQNAPSEGVIYWTGKLTKNRVVTIEAGKANVGHAEGDLFPGAPIAVKVLSPAIELVERPSPKNNWKKAAFRCLRSTKRNVTINIQWHTPP